MYLHEAYMQVEEKELVLEMNFEAANLTWKVTYGGRRVPKEAVARV